MKLAIIGAAQIVSQYHIHALNAIPAVEITTVIDLDVTRAREVAQQSNAKFSSELSDAKGADAVLIATPPEPRAQIIANMPEGVKYVIIEKPAGMTKDDIKELNKIAASRELRIAVAQTRRYFPNLCLCADLLEAGLVGEIEKVTLSEGAIMNWNSNSNHLSQAADRNDKGVLQDVGSHLFDWLGVFLTKVDANAQDFRLTECSADFHDLSNDITVDFSGPFAIETRLSRRRLLSNTIRIKGEKGELLTRSLLDDCVRFKKPGAVKWNVVRTEIDKSGFALEAAFIAMWEDLLSLNPFGMAFPDLKSVGTGFEFIQQTINHLNK